MLLSLLSHYAPSSAPPDLEPDDVATEEAFRASCARRCADPALKDLPVLRRVAAVGALGFTFGGATQDDRIIRNVLIHAHRAGLKISGDYEVDCVNFMQRRDFLKERWKYDIVAICFIIGFPKLERLNNPLQIYESSASDVPQNLGFMLSTDHSIGRWQERIRDSGARLVATYGGKDEINTRDLEIKNSLVEILPSARSHAPFNQGYLARPDFIESYRTHPAQPLDPGTVLGRALRACS
jgi:hypothetical protein